MAVLQRRVVIASLELYALRAYRIREPLVAASPGNARWQRDLSVSRYLE
jgi:hypothetical protein